MSGEHGITTKDGLAIIGGLGIGVAALVYARVDGGDPQSAAPSDEQRNGIECPTAEFEFPDPITYEDYQLTGEVEVKLGLDPAEAERFAQGFRQSLSFEESEGLLNDAFGRWGVTASVSSLPTPAKGITTATQLSHNPDGITQHLLDVSARKAMQRMSRLPAPILEAITAKGLNIHFTDGIQNEETEFGAYYYPEATDGKPALVLSVGAAHDTGDMFMWGVTTMLMEATCSGSRNEEGLDPDYAKLNPEGFTYTDDEYAYHDQRAYDIVAGADGMLSLEDDIRLLYDRILTRQFPYECNPDGYSYIEKEKDTPLCLKATLLMQRIAAIDEKSAQYLIQI